MIENDSGSSYRAHVTALQQRLQRDEALQQAIGGDFLTIGKLEYYLLRSLGLNDGHLIVDVGCGSGRLACQLAPFSGIRYIGCDVVGELLQYAAELCKRDDWAFVETDGARIPCADSAADFACFFSIFTHLVHEDSFKYFREAQRVLKPDGLLVFSFLEFSAVSHWNIFLASVEQGESRPHHNQFMDREAIRAWANHTGFDVDSVRSGDSRHIPIPEEVVFDHGVRMEEMGTFGQSVAVLRKKGKQPAP